MGNSFLGLFLRRFAAPRPGCRKAAQFFGLVVDAAKIDVGEADDPIAIVSLGNSNRLADQHLADEHAISAPLDIAARTHPAHGVIGIVPGFLDAIGVRSRRGGVPACRRLLVERFMRPVVIVVFAEAIEASLLLPRGRGGRSRGLLLERAVKALMPSVLLRTARINALEFDAELHPFNR